MISLDTVFSAGIHQNSSTFDVGSITELTPELLRLFIEKIVIHEKEVKWSKHAPQTVEIYYNGIGYVGSGQQDAEETPEAPDPLQTQDTEKPRQAS